ncbi:MAG: PEP-CTERM sorting domain-containing protein [Janthinobacterium lividum]
MRLTKVIAVAVIATASAAAAAPNLVVNGGFETGYTHSVQFNPAFHPTEGPTGWTTTSGNNAYNLYVDSATVTSQETITQSSEAGQYLPSAFVASPDGGKFVILDGDPSYSGPLTQMINGLIVGKQYSVGFYWGASELMSRAGPTTDYLEVSLGSTSQNTVTLSTPTHGFQGWFTQKFVYTATATSEALTFLSHGTPGGLPPVAVLDGVSVTAVPEPAMWGLMVAGFGLIGVVARRRRPVVVTA